MSSPLLEGSEFDFSLIRLGFSFRSCCPHRSEVVVVVVNDNGCVGGGNSGGSGSGKGFRDLLKLSGHHCHSFKRLDRERDHDENNHRDSHSDFDLHSVDSSGDVLGDSAPPQWALLLLGCLLGLATGLFVAAFNKGVHVIHEWAWLGTPNEGATWLRLQRLADTWHRILLIPVTGGVLLAGIFPTINAIQAAITLGTGCSLGPECANGFSLMMENNRERRIALVAAGAAAGISSGFNAAVAGCFFAIETVLRPLRVENSPPFTTAMIILASVISSTVSNVLQGTQSAFTVPEYQLKSAADNFCDRIVDYGIHLFTTSKITAREG